MGMSSAYYAILSCASYKMRRSYLKGITGDAMNVLLSACGQNMEKLLKWLSWAEIKALFMAFMGPFLGELKSQKQNVPLVLA